MSVSNEIFAGIDVSKPHLDLAIWDDQRSWRFCNDPDGIQVLAQQLIDLAPTLIAIEATGGYEQVAAHQLSQAGLPVAIVSLHRVRALARAKGLLATPALAGGARETDRLDARNLAHFAQAVRPKPRPPAAQFHLAGLVSRRRQLLQMLTAERNRLRNALPAVRSHLQTHISWLKRAIQELDAEIEPLLTDQDEQRARAELLCSAPAVGTITAASLLAECPELGSLDRKKIAALVGVAPDCTVLPKDAGTVRYGELRPEPIQLLLLTS